MNAKRDTGPRLGRGLAALLGDVAVQPQPQGSAIQKIPLDLLEPNPFQPRTVIDPATLDELAQSIRLRGVLQPLLVRPHPSIEGRYQIVAGERRWRAAAAAGLHEVPTLTHPMDDTEAAAIALVENLQREDLNAIDEAEGYNRLISQFSLTQDALAHAVGKSRSHVTNTLRLLNLPQTVKEALRKGEITAGHARALLTHPQPEAALREVVDGQLSVRQTENLASREPRIGDSADWNPKHRPDLAALERDLAEQLGLKVRVTFDGKKGAIQFYYANLDQLDNLLSRLITSK